MSASTSKGMRWTRGALAILGVGAVALTGCTAGGGGGSASAGETTVTVMYQSNEFSKDDIAAFEKANPGIKIDFIEYDETRLNAMLTAGDPPDFVRGSPSANLFARGLAAPLDDYLAESDVLKKDDLLPVNDAWRWDGKTRGEGKLYGVIKDFSPDTTVWVNTALLAQAGVEVPSATEPMSWDDLLADAVKLKAAGIAYPLGIEWQWGVSSLFQTMILQQGGTVYNDDMTKVDLATPEAERALQWLTDYGTAGVGPTSLNPLADGWDLPVYSTGQMAMTLDGYWFGGGLQSQDAAAVAGTSTLIPAPTFGERLSPVFGGVGAWIPEASKNKDAAWKVMEFFMGEDPAVARSKSGWGLPVLDSLWTNLPTAEPYQQTAMDTAKGELDHAKPLADSPYITATVWNDAIDKVLQSTIKGEASVDDALKTLQGEINDALAQGKDQLG
ncbi:ABC transporter substrate-binding protein [Microbacterium sp. B2969]|uniref:ABC transporter substrate-binding protein n=1 Tax=Microbacterium alkaliflavum TaxID=3248839 RepID=A0ABW7QFJ8_9MICO